ncbi:MAG TPA: alpha/beta hydrolase domain-containing protein [Acidimicrobiales bacterium]
MADGREATGRFRSRLLRPVGALAAFPIALMGVVATPRSTAVATGPGVNKVEMGRPTLAFQGRSFGAVGRYEKIRGIISGAVDPTDPRNSLITDLANAPRNRQGLVEYKADFMLLRPVDLSKGNHRVVYEPTNRGNVVSLFTLNNAKPVNDPSGFLDAGDGFLMRQGYSLVDIAWDSTVTAGDNRLLATVPVATNADGSAIEGPALEEITFDDLGANAAPLTYPAATLDQSQATLTMRLRYDDTPIAVPSSAWSYNSDGTGIQLAPNTSFAQSALYELTYRAKNPLVVGLGFAAIRDVADFLRNQTADAYGNPNPLAGDVQQMLAFCYSQPCRALHDFVRLGFNETAAGGRAVDGILSLVAGASGGFFDYRFAQPNRSMRQHIGRWYPERQFPFTDQVITDSVTGQTDGVLRRCTMSNTCPKIFEVNSETEYWNKAASLLTTDTQGNDLDLSKTPNVRYYLLSSLPHAPEIGNGVCEQVQNPLLPNPVARALLVDLDQWVSNGTEPPPNQVPLRSNGTLVPATPQSGVGFPTIPNVTYNGRITTGDLFDFGSQASQGILTTLPPNITPSAYPAFVPETDADGNDVAGIRLPEISVPTATYSGWNVRADAFANDDMCNATGQKIAFAPTKKARLASDDPRPSIEERYRSRAEYVAKVAVAANRLKNQGFLLSEDVARYIAAALLNPPV